MNISLDSIKKHAAEVVKKYQLELISVELVKEFGTDIIRIIIDDLKTFLLDIDVVAQINEEILTLINDLMPDNAMLEVSSLGAERDLISEADYKRAIDRYIYVEIKEKLAGTGGIKEFFGYLKAYNENEIVIEANFKGRIKTLTVPNELLKKIRLAVKF